MTRGSGRHGLLVVTILVAACGGSSPEEFRTGDVIQACAPVSGQLSVGETMDYMAGRYRLVMLRDGSRAQAFGVLDLERVPEAFRDWGSSSASLMGSADIDLTAAGAQGLDGLDSTDPEQPGVLVLEGPTTAGPSIVLRFGSDANRRDTTPFDGPSTALNILAIEGDRFAGSWQSSVGAERVEGFFCAERIEP